MALAAMDSESGYLPLDYLQGHKDSLEWAAQLAEANHPETGDWLYDDPIELAKAIRKGPDMPPAQPVADSEPDRNPVLAYADSYRDMAKQGVESVPIWSVITELERNIAPLYHHTQPAKTVRPVMFIDGDISSEDADKLAKVIRELHEKDERPLAKMARIIRENPRPTNECDMPKAQPVPAGPDDVSIFEAAIEECKTCDSIDEHAWNHGVLAVIAKYEAYRAAMLAAAPQSPGSEPATVPGKWVPVSEQMPEVGVKVLCFPVKDEPIHATFNGQLWLQDVSWCGSEEPIDNVIPVTVTHWMPLPAAPQEPKP
ncbi:DUF551 domain-containing protein [Klebsiella pneumoniae]|uniref:DUF551 domain-containing protein n=2 Tax=Klebsiella pneumoniae TaxID=573 RepID=UPI0035C0D5C5